MKIFSIFDRAAQVYNTPFFQAARGVALRSFQDLTNDSQSMVHKHPGDYQLYCLGGFDEETGELMVCKPELIANAIDLVIEKNK